MAVPVNTFQQAADRVLEKIWCDWPDDQNQKTAVVCPLGGRTDPESVHVA